MKLYILLNFFGFNLIDDPSPNALDILKECQKKLEKIIFQNFDKAATKNDVTEIYRFFKLFKLVGKSEDGLLRFGQYLSTIVSNKCESLFNSYNLLNSDLSKFRWIDLFTEILDFIAGTLKENQISVETYYGSY